MQAGKLKVALVGAGAVAQVAHLPALRECSATELSAVCDSLPEIGEPIAAEHSVPYRRAYEAVLDDPNVEAVILTTPRGTHASLASQALMAGKHVLCEKPAALRLDDVVRMKQVAAETGCILMIGYMWHYDPAVCAARQTLAELGRPIFATQYLMLGADFFSSAQGANLSQGVRRAGRYVPKSQIRSRSDAVGLLDETGWPTFASDKEWNFYALVLEYWTHQFDLARVFLGEPQSMEHASVFPEGPGFSFCQRLSGVSDLCVFATGPGVHFECGMHIAAERGWLKIGLPPFSSRACGWLELCQEGNGHVQSVPIAGDRPFLAQLKHFAACVRTARQPETGIDGAIMDIRLAEVLIESFRTGRRAEI